MRAVLCCLAIVASGWAVAGSASIAASDAKTRLGLMINFAKYTQWPESIKPEVVHSWNFCIIEGDRELENILKNLEPIDLYEVPVNFSLIRATETLTSCHVAYIPNSIKRRDMSRLFERAEQNGVLTVSDMPDFARQGGMVEMVADEGRYKFDVDYISVLRSDLKLESGMLKLARRVR